MKTKIALYIGFFLLIVIGGTVLSWLAEVFILDPLKEAEVPKHTITIVSFLIFIIRLGIIIYILRLIFAYMKRRDERIARETEDSVRDAYGFPPRRITARELQRSISARHSTYTPPFDKKIRTDNDEIAEEEKMETPKEHPKPTRKKQQIKLRRRSWPKRK